MSRPYNNGLPGTPVEIGMPVERITRHIRQDGDKHGRSVYGYKCRPVLK